MGSWYTCWAWVSAKPRIPDLVLAGDKEGCVWRGGGAGGVCVESLDREAESRRGLA